MKKIFITLLLFLPAMLFAKGEKVLAVYMNDETSVYFLLEEQPVITFVDDAVKIVSATNEATVKRANVKEFKFINDLPAGIEDVYESGEVAKERFELSKSSIVIEGLAPGCVVRLLSVNGQAVKSVAAAENGTATVTFDALPSGVYVVNYNETSIKFVK